MRTALFIGGTGTISSAITARLAADPGWQLYLLNRGSRSAQLPPNVRTIIADIHDEAAVSAALQGMTFDVVCDFIAFNPADVQRDYRLFSGRCRQYLFISTASAYHKPARSPYISESTTLANPYWDYSRQKIACEEFLLARYRDEGFPVTIVRPSHTYGDRAVPLGVKGTKGSWQVLKRMLEGKPVLIHGDGSSLWTLTHNTDFAAGFVGLLDNPHALGEAFQITCDECMTWDEIYRTIAACLGVPLRAYHVSSDFLAACAPAEYDYHGSLMGDKAVTVLFDGSKLKRAVPGFCPVVSMAEGLRRTVAYVLAHPELQVEDPEFDAWCDRVIAALEKTKAELSGQN